MTAWHVGQEVLLLEPFRSGEPTRVPVVRVGRTLVYVLRYGREVPFDQRTGEERRSSNAGGSGSSIRTPEQHAARQERAALIARLRELDVGAVGYRQLRYSNTTLAAIIALLEADPS